MEIKEMRQAILRRLDSAPAEVFTGEQLSDLGDPQGVLTEVSYLEELGLLKAEYCLSGKVAWARITSRGRDYVDPSGGIGGELNVVTVKLHEDTLRQIFINRVNASDADSTVKGKLIDQIKSLPAEALSKLAEKALEEGLRYMPHALQWLQTAQWS